LFGSFLGLQKCEKLISAGRGGSQFEGCAAVAARKKREMQKLQA